MAAVRAFRFGYQIPPTITTAPELRRAARDAEDAGFDVFHSWDHIGESTWGPLTPLSAAAAVTERMRLCPLVLNNDFHHPAHLARELASLDHLSDGRVEVGLGAGHGFPEYAAIGRPFDPPPTRKARLAEAVEILRRLLDGEEVTVAGEHYRLDGLRTKRPLQERVPILVGVQGRTALAHAARHADAVGLSMLGRTLADGQRHEARWEPWRLDRTVAHIGDQARDRRSPLRLQALVQMVVVTDDRRAAAEHLVADQRLGDLGVTVDDALSTPFLAVGTHDQIADHLVACRRRWGIDYVSVRDVAGFAPVIERLRTRDAAAGHDAV